MKHILHNLQVCHSEGTVCFSTSHSHHILTLDVVTLFSLRTCEVPNSTLPQSLYIRAVCTQNILLYLQYICLGKPLYSSSTSPTKRTAIPLSASKLFFRVVIKCELKYIFAEITLKALHTSSSTCKGVHHHSHLLKYSQATGKRQMDFQVPKGESKQQCLCKLPFAVVSFPNLRKDAYGEDAKLLKKP